MQVVEGEFMKRIGTMIILGSMFATFAAKAEVVAAHANGFEVKEVATIEAPARRVYDSLVKIGSWWNPQHSFSGLGTNLVLDPRAGGCFCEALANGGSVHHMTVVMAMPDKLLRMTGALGPLQPEGVAGSMTWSLRPVDSGTELTLTYIVGGYARRPLTEWAPDVDAVLSDQVSRLKNFVETHKP
jgi:uncharacterized protein YndB with AHSA1/START domain